MKWCRYTANGLTSYGIIEGDTVHEVSGSPFGEHSKTGAAHALDAVQLEVPVIPPTFTPRASTTRSTSPGPPT